MSDFGASIDLELTVPQRELDNVAQQIEDTVGVTEMGVTDGGSMSAQAANGGGRARRRARQSFRMERTRTSLLDDATVYLESIDDKVGELGGGGGGGVSSEITGALFETGGDAAIEGGSTLLDLGVETLGTAIGNTISGLFGNGGGSPGEGEQPANPLFGKPEWVPIKVSEPSWGPITVEDPGSVGFEELPGPVGYESLPGPVSFEELPGPVKFEEIPGPVGFETLPGPVGFETLPGPVSVEDVDPVEVEPIDVEVTVRAPGTDGTSSRSREYEPDSVGDQFDESVADGVDFLTPGEDIRTDEEGGPGQSPGDWLQERWNEGVGFITGQDSSGGGQTGGDAGSSGPTRTTRQGGNTTTNEAPTVNVEVSVGSTRVTVDAALDSLIDEVMDEVEREYDGQLDEIESDLREALNDIDSLQGALGGGGRR